MKFIRINFKKYIRQQKGFSLMGVLVSFFIMAVGIVAILSLANISLKGFGISKKNLIASHLAQEGIEIVRYIRQANEDADNRWADWYNGFSTAPRAYRVQYDKDRFLRYSETPLKIDDYGLYQYDLGQDTGFYRKLTIRKMGTNQLQVVVDVKWRDQNGNWSHLIAEDRLWNWR